MFKKLLLAIATLIVTMGLAFAQVDVNKASQAELDGVKGIGPKISKTIIEERKKGDFKDWADLEKRVKGIGEKNSVKLSQAGLTVGGQSKAGAPAKAGKKAEKADKKEDKKAEKAEKSDKKKDKKSQKDASASVSAPAPASAKDAKK